MRVRRNFDRIYRRETDPWSIGLAADPRYDLYLDLLEGHARGGRLLDIGCGLGAFLARFEGEFDELTGVETAEGAVRRARELHPEIEFVHAPAERIDETELDGRSFDAIIVSDILCYLRQRDRAMVVAWVGKHLAPGGYALVAGWSPGGRYLAPDEFRALVRASLRIVEDVVLPSGHVALVTRAKRRLAGFVPAPVAGAVTVDVAQDADPDRVAEHAVAALPREPTPERMRFRHRLERLRVVRRREASRPTGDELVAIVGGETNALKARLETHGFTIVSADALAAAAAESL